MSARELQVRPKVVIAVDFPNVSLTVAEHYGSDADIDWAGLNAWLQMDGVENLGLTCEDVDFRSRVFMQKAGEAQSAGRETVVDRHHLKQLLSKAGWSVFEKPEYKATPELGTYVSRLSHAFFLPGREQIEYLRAWTPEVPAPEKLQVLAHEALKVFPEYLTRADKVSLQSLARLAAHPLFQAKLVERLTQVYSDVVSAEATKRDQVLRAILQDYAQSNLAEQFPWVRLPNLERASQNQIIRVTRQVLNALQPVNETEKRIRDIDDDLNHWVADQTIPLAKQRQRGIVYLVGNDIRNHLVIAERIRLRYHMEVRFVMCRRMYDDLVSSSNRAKLDAYGQTMFIDQFVTHGSRLEVGVA